MKNPSHKNEIILGVKLQTIKIAIHKWKVTSNPEH